MNVDKEIKALERLHDDYRKDVKKKTTHLDIDDDYIRLLRTGRGSES